MAATNGHSEGQEEVMEHDEFMALHQNNNQNSAPSPSEQAHLIDNVVESELETDDKGLENLSAKDFPLSNYDDEVDTVEFKWLQEILNMFSKARHPHPDSALQGLARAWAVGDSDERLEALGPDDVARDESYLMGTYSRAKRGEGMAQQETSAKQVQESHAIRHGSGSSSSGGGLLGRFRS